MDNDTPRSFLIAGAIGGIISAIMMVALVILIIARH